MRKLLVGLLLAGLSASAMAEWVWIGEDERYTIYFDPAVTLGKGGTRIIWTLQDYKQPQFYSSVTQYKSVRMHWEFECKARRSRVLENAFHAEALAQGDVIVGSTTPEEWRQIRPDSLTEIFGKRACQAKVGPKPPAKKK